MTATAARRIAAFPGRSRRGGASATVTAALYLARLTERTLSFAPMSEPADLFEVEAVDVRGVQLRVFRHVPPSLRAVWEASEAHGDAPYLVYRDERLTFADAHRLVRALAARLTSVHGVRPGDRVAIAMRNYPEWPIAFWATTSLGAVAVPLNAWWTGPELAYGLSDSGSVLLFADEERAERVEPLLGDTDVRTTILVRAD